MRALEGSIGYSLLHKLFDCYQYSYLKKIVIRIVEAYRQSILGKAIKSVVDRESSLDHSVFIGFIKSVFYKVDKWLLRFSESLVVWSDTSAIVVTSRFIIKASKEKLFLLLVPLFGMGYMAGRIILNRLMIRDILFLGLTFFIAAVFMIDPEKRKAIWKSSLAYQLVLLVLD